MKVYKGIISGIGNADTRENEISSDDVAVLRNFIIGYGKGDISLNGGVIGEDSFTWEMINKNTIEISSGMAFAYGYFGYFPSVQFSFYIPAVTQYHIIYAEFDKSKIPNEFNIKIKNNQSTPYIRETTFRRDVLSSIKTGVHQLPLWQIEINNKGALSITDLRKKFNYIKTQIENVVDANYANYVKVNGILQSGVTCETAPEGDNSLLIANTEFVDREIKKEINR